VPGQHLGDDRLECDHVLVDSLAVLAAGFGDRLLERAALIHRRRRDHAVLVGTGVDAVELTLCQLYLRHIGPPYPIVDCVLGAV
jgi:hypothetical protein